MRKKRTDILTLLKQKENELEQLRRRADADKTEARSSLIPLLGEAVIDLNDPGLLKACAEVLAAPDRKRVVQLLSRMGVNLIGDSPTPPRFETKDATPESGTGV